MEIPKSKQTKEQFLGDIEKHVKENYALFDLDNFFYCKKCCNRIAWIICHVSVHDLVWEDVCAGGGQVVNAMVPYCPGCEGKPKNIGIGCYSACWHE